MLGEILPILKSREIIRIFENSGFINTRKSRGSHSVTLIQMAEKQPFQCLSGIAIIGQINMKELYSGYKSYAKFKA